MFRKTGLAFRAQGFILLAASVVLAAGCSKSPDATSNGSEPPSGRQMGGPSGPDRPGGGRGKAVAENATGAEVYQAKCGCHGMEGKGGKAPVLTGVGSRSDDDLYKIIHDGHDKMPAFGTQLSEAQIKKAVTYLKQLKPAS